MLGSFDCLDTSNLLVGEEKKRLLNRERKRLIKTGINAIDDPMGGLIDTELLIIASDTGLGKTQIAKNIAHNCALNDTKVFFLALEAHEDEFYARVHYDAFCKNMYFEHEKKVSYRNWLTRNYSAKAEEIDLKTQNDVSEKISQNVSARYKGRQGYTTLDLELDLNQIKSDRSADIVIIDHLHYFDYTGEKESNEISKIMKQTRTLALDYKIPIILISHLRKPSKMDKALAPDEKELHGSSEIAKVATSVLTISPDYETERDTPYYFPTFFRLCKDRHGGAAKRYLLSCDFDVRDGTYRDKYRIAKLNKHGDELSKIDDLKFMPDWAVNKL